MEHDSILRAFRLYGESVYDAPAPGEKDARQEALSALIEKIDRARLGIIARFPLIAAVVAGFAFALLILILSPAWFQALVACLPL